MHVNLHVNRSKDQLSFSLPMPNLFLFFQILPPAYCIPVSFFFCSFCCHSIRHSVPLKRHFPTCPPSNFANVLVCGEKFVVEPSPRARTTARPVAGLVFAAV